MLATRNDARKSQRTKKKDEKFSNGEECQTFFTARLTATVPGSHPGHQY